MEKIKIVFIQYWLDRGGAEQALYDLIALLDKDKFDVTVFVEHPDKGWDQKFWEAGIRVDYDYTCRKPTWNPVKKVGNYLKKQKIEEAKNNAGKGLIDICCPGADIVVAYSTWDRDEIGFAEGAKSIQYVHSDIATHSDYYRTVTGKIEQLKRCDKIVCVSNRSRESFCRITGISENVVTIFNPLNSVAVREKAEKKVDLPTDAPLICAVGRLAIEKGFDRLVYIHKRLLEKGIYHKLVIVGDGEDMDLLRRLVRITETEDTVILAGYQENPYPYMKQSKFLVNSSFTEGLPVIAMEALSLGVPIVASAPSVEEAFGDEICGLITGTDTADLELGIQKMLTDEAFYAQCKAGAERRSAFFDGKRMVKDVEKMFLELAQKE